MSFTPSPAPARFELPDRGVLGDLRRGLWLPFRALRLIFVTPKLRALSLAGAVVTSLTLAGAAVGCWELAQALGHRWAGAGGVGTALAAVLWVVLFATSALTLPNLLLAPLQDPLSEATEQACGGGLEAAPFSVQQLLRGTVVSLSHTVTRLCFMLLGTVLLWPLNFIPGAGSGLWMVSSTLWSAFWLSAEQLSTPMARRLRPFGEVVRLLRSRPGLALGLGGCLWVLLWLPLVNFFLLPIAVVAGTLLFRGLLAPDGNANQLPRVGAP